MWLRQGQVQLAAAAQGWTVGVEGCGPGRSRTQNGNRADRAERPALVDTWIQRRSEEQWRVNRRKRAWGWNELKIDSVAHSLLDRRGQKGEMGRAAWAAAATTGCCQPILAQGRAGQRQSRVMALSEEPRRLQTYLRVTAADNAFPTPCLADGLLPTVSSPCRLRCALFLRLRNR